MQLRDEVAEQWAAAHEFAERSMSQGEFWERNRERFNEDDLALDNTVETLVIRFLFPTSSEMERSVLLAVRLAVRAYTLGIRTPRRALSGESSIAHEQATNSAEQDFLAAKDIVLATSLYLSASPLQREIIERFYIAVPAVSTEE